jgi:glycosyltransferase involved in cell wall biosynthesis
MVEDEETTGDARPRVLVSTTLFPSTSQPSAGVFIRERMFRVGKELPLKVVAPQPWFPCQSLLRLLKPSFRPSAPPVEVQEGVEVLRPRFFCVPGVLKSLDGIFLALSSYLTLRRLSRRFDFHLIDAHFGYPDGYAAVELGKWLRRPVTITLRGTEPRHSRTRGVKRYLRRALDGADRIFCVSESLRRHALAMGIGTAEKVLVVGNGVDAEKFHALPKTDSRLALGLRPDAKVLITVGGLVERKGFHRVIALLPKLCKKYPNLHYLVVGGPSAEGDWSERLNRQVEMAGLRGAVSFLGALPHREVKRALSAADVFVLATSNEGWANVILEAMACGLPVIATDVGGNAEVVKDGSLGTIVPFGDPGALETGLDEALQRGWDRGKIVAYAMANSWDQRVETLVREFRAVSRRTQGQYDA